MNSLFPETPHSQPNLEPSNPSPDPSRINPDPGKQSADTDQPASFGADKDQEKSDSHSHPEKTPEALKHAQASKLATWVKQSAALLQQLENKEPAAQGKQALNAVDGIIVEEAVQQVVGKGHAIIDKAISNVGAFKLLGVDMDMGVASGFVYASTLGKELAAGINFLGSKWRLNNLKLEREAVMQRLEAILDQRDQIPADQQDLYDSTVAELTRQKVQINVQIEKMEESNWKKTVAFLGTHLEAWATTVTTVLGQVHDQAAMIAASGGGTGVGAAGMLMSTAGVIKGVLNYRKIDDQLVDIINVSEKHVNPNVSTAIGAVKAIALDHAASHQRNNILLDVFQNAFTFCQSGISAAMSIIMVVAVAAVGTAAGAGAVSAATALAPGIPIVTGIGILLAGAVAIYRNRHTLRRGLKELGKGNYSLERNLAYRQWKKQREFKFISKKMLELGEEHAKLKAGTPSNKGATEKAMDMISANDGSFYSMVASVARAGAVLVNAGLSTLERGIDESFFAGESKNICHIDKGDIEEVDRAIQQLAGRFFELKEELERINSKLEGQRLSDETGDISRADVTTVKAIDSAIKHLEVRIASIDDVTAQLCNGNLKIAETAYKKISAKQIKLAEKSEKELDTVYNELLNPSERTIEKMRLFFNKKIEEKTDRLRLLHGDRKKDSSALKIEADALREEIAELEKYNSNDVASGIQFEKNRISELLIKVKADLNTMRHPNWTDFNELAEIFKSRRNELTENIAVLKVKKEQVQNNPTLQLEIDEAPRRGELNQLEEGVAVIDPIILNSSQGRLIEAIKALGEGDELLEFAAVFEKMGVSFEEMEGRQYKNLYVQAQIQKAITSRTIAWK